MSCPLTKQRCQRVTTMGAGSIIQNPRFWEVNRGLSVHVFNMQTMEYLKRMQQRKAPRNFRRRSPSATLDKAITQEKEEQDPRLTEEKASTPHTARARVRHVQTTERRARANTHTHVHRIIPSFRPFWKSGPIERPVSPSIQLRSSASF